MRYNFLSEFITIQTGFLANYTHLLQNTDDVGNVMTHLMRLNIKTPLDFLKDLRTNTIVEIEGNRRKVTIAIRGEQLIIDLFGDVKVRFSQNS